MTVSRREMLASLLGLSALASCKRRAPSIDWDGGFVGPSFEAGHRLRNGPRIDLTEPPREVAALVLGAGVSGLSAAWHLAGRHVDFRVLELEPRPGGTSTWGTTGTLEHPWGAHYLPAPTSANPDLVELLESMGSVVDRDHDGEPVYAETELCAAPTERVFFHGFWYEGLYPTAGATKADLEQFARFSHEIDRLVAWRDGERRRAFVLPSVNASPDPSMTKFDQRSMAGWMDEHRFDSPRLRWYVEYACRDDYGGDLEDTSAWAGLFYFASRVPAPGRPSAEFLTWPEGNGHLVKRMLARIGNERLLTGVLVAGVRPAPDGRRAVVTTVDVATGKPASWIAEKVIFALPSYLRRHLLGSVPGVPEYEPRYGSWLVANVTLREFPESRGYPQAWDNVIYGSRSLGYVVATHQLQKSHGRTVWTYYLPIVEHDVAKAREALLALSYRDACDAIISDLARAHVGLEPQIERIDIMRWGHAMVRPGPGSVFPAARQRAAQSVGPIHFAHADLSGLALFEEAYFHGTRAAREVIRSLGA